MEEDKELDKPEKKSTKTGKYDPFNEYDQINKEYGNIS